METGISGETMMFPRSLSAVNYAIRPCSDLPPSREGRHSLLAGGADSFSRITYTDLPAGRYRLLKSASLLIATAKNGAWEKERPCSCLN